MFKKIFIFGSLSLLTIIGFWVYTLYPTYSNLLEKMQISVPKNRPSAETNFPTVYNTSLRPDLENINNEGNATINQPENYVDGVHIFPTHLEFYIEAFTQSFNETVISTPQILTLSNNTSYTKRISNIYARTNNLSRFDIIENQCIGDLQPQQSCQIKMKFKTKNYGQHEGQLAVYIENKKIEVKLQGYY